MAPHSSISCQEDLMDSGAWWAAVHEESDATEHPYDHLLSCT